MARLEDLVTPTELLDAIRSGWLKDELVKKYRASEQDLALMLQPLYRGGRLTKDEFNDFFKGIMLSPQQSSQLKEPEARSGHTGNSYDAPTEMIPTASLTTPPTPEPPREEAGEREGIAEPDRDITRPEFIHPEMHAQVNPERANEDSGGNGEEELAAAPGSAAVATVLHMIYSRLNDIEERLIQIEKKLGIPD